MGVLASIWEREMSDALEAFRSLQSSETSCWFESVSQLVDGQTVIATTHANGFWKVRLRLFPDGSKLRLHLWSALLPANPHDHRWHFSAAVLQGELCETCFAPVTSQLEGVAHSVYTMKAGHLRDAGRVERLQTVSTNTLVQGSTYWRAAGLVHSVVATRAKTVSIVATERAIDNRNATVLSPVGRLPVSGSAHVDALSHSAFLDSLAKRLDLDSPEGQ